MNTEKELKSRAKTIAQELKILEEHRAQSLVKQSQLDMIIVDLQHEIELERVDAISMVQKYKMLQTALRLRRKYKNQRSYLDSFFSVFDIEKIENLNERISKITDNIKMKQYRHRIKIEVREELLKEIQKEDTND